MGLQPRADQVEAPLVCFRGDNARQRGVRDALLRCIWPHAWCTRVAGAIRVVAGAVHVAAGAVHVVAGVRGALLRNGVERAHHPALHHLSLRLDVGVPDEDAAQVYIYTYIHIHIHICV